MNSIYRHGRGIFCCWRFYNEKSNSLLWRRTVIQSSLTLTAIMWITFRREENSAVTPWTRAYYNNDPLGNFFFFFSVCVFFFFFCSRFHGRNDPYFREIGIRYLRNTGSQRTKQNVYEHWRHGSPAVYIYIPQLVTNR